MVKDLFGSWLMNCPWGCVPFDSIEGDEDDVYQSLFDDDREGEGVLIDTRSILRMCLKKARVVWIIRFESKSHPIRPMTPG